MSIAVGLMILGGIMAAYMAFMVLRWLTVYLFKEFIRSCLPAETRILEWLQDRASARALGVDYDLYMARKRIDRATKPIDISKRN